MGELAVPYNRGEGSADPTGKPLWTIHVSTLK